MSNKLTIWFIGILIFAAIIIWQTSMVVFMGIFFVFVSWLKLGDLAGFAHAFSMYDLIAKKSMFYAYLYPFIELFLGISFLFSWNIKITAIITLVLMIIGIIGIALSLLSKNKIHCACLGTLINVPLTNFTLFEDIIMSLMAIWILINV